MQDKKIKLFYIEDDKIDQMAFERFANKEKLSYEYTMAGSVKEARNHLESQNFDIVVSDYMLRDGTAFDILHLSEGTPTIIVTGTGDEEIAVKAMKSGAYDYLIKDTKGNYIKTLPVTIENALRRKKAEEEIKQYSEGLEEMVDERTEALNQEINTRKKIEIMLRENEKNLSVLNRIDKIFLTVPGDEMYGEVLQVVLEATKSKNGVFGYIDEDGAVVTPSMTRDVWEECKSPDKNIIFPRETWGDTIWSRAIIEKRSLYTNEPGRVPEGHLPIHRVLVVPIIYQGDTIGLFEVANKKTNYDDKDREFLEKIAVQVASILNSRLQSERFKAREKRLEEQFLQSQKMEAIGTLASGIAHDFNNLLTTILGNAHMIMTEMKKDDSFREEVEDIVEAGQRASNLTRQLLVFSRKQVFIPVDLDLNATLSNMEKMLNRLIGENIEITVIQGPELWQVIVDSVQIEQVITNLAINARDAMPYGGKLTFETANVHLDSAYISDYCMEVQPGPYVKLTVSDTGEGMDKEMQSRIFEPFFTTKDRDKGTGLGLYTVYGIVKQNKGHILVDSRPGKGSIFKIYLPV